MLKITKILFADLVPSEPLAQVTPPPPNLIRAVATTSTAYSTTTTSASVPLSIPPPYLPSGIAAGKNILDTLNRPVVQPSSNANPAPAVSAPSFPQPPRVALGSAGGVNRSASLNETVTAAADSLPKALYFEPVKNLSILNQIKPNLNPNSNPNPNPSPILPLSTSNEKISEDFSTGHKDAQVAHSLHPSDLFLYIKIFVHDIFSY